MKRLLFLILVVNAVIAESDTLQLADIAAQHHEKMPILLGLMSSKHDLKEVAKGLKNDLEFTNQFEVTIKQVHTIERADQVKRWQAEGYPLIMYLEAGHGDNADSYTWRLYDTSDAHMIAGKKIMRKSDVNASAHAVADQIWPELTGVAGSFSTKIVYGKEACRRGRHCKRYLYMRDATDSKGKSEQLLVSSPTISVAPRWNRDEQNPLVLYSEFTKTNVRLIAVDMQRKRRVVSNFDGVNMQVAYAPDGSKVVYCLSRSPSAEFADHDTSQLYYVSKKDKKPGQAEQLQRLTTNNGNNLNPSWGPGNTIFYASDANAMGLPNICWMDLDTKKITWITQGVYATCPHYSPQANKLIYTRMVNKKMQVWSYDFANNSHEQLTFDATNKDDCSWAPCGTLATYSVENKGVSRIAILNTLTKEQKFLTPAHEDCSYPAWSGYYAQLPVVS